jgi:hypothetical protein
VQRRDRELDQARVEADRRGVQVRSHSSSTPSSAAMRAARTSSTSRAAATSASRRASIGLEVLRALAAGGEPPAQDAERAVQPAAVRHRVDPPAEDHRPLGPAGQGCPQVPRLVRVDVDRQLGQPLAQPVAGAGPRVGPREALRAALVAGQLTECPQVGDGATGSNDVI